MLYRLSVGFRLLRLVRSEFWCFTVDAMSDVVHMLYIIFRLLALSAQCSGAPVQETADITTKLHRRFIQ
jgi:hypothetical protein